MRVIWVAGRTRTPIIGSLQKSRENPGFMCSLFLKFRCLRCAAKKIEWKVRAKSPQWALNLGLTGENLVLHQWSTQNQIEWTACFCILIFCFWFTTDDGLTLLKIITRLSPIAFVAQNKKSNFLLCGKAVFTPKLVSLTQVSRFTTMYVVKWWHALETCVVWNKWNKCHHFTTYIVVKRDTCFNDTSFGVNTA